MKPEYVHRVDWLNVGIHVNLFTRFYPNVCILTPWFNLIFKRWDDRLFSERYGYKPTLKLFGLCVTFVRLKRMRDAALPEVRK